jgi:hypothetical protein
MFVCLFIGQTMLCNHTLRVEFADVHVGLKETVVPGTIVA